MFLLNLGSYSMHFYFVAHFHFQTKKLKFQRKISKNYDNCSNQLTNKTNFLMYKLNRNVRLRFNCSLFSDQFCFVLRLCSLFNRVGSFSCQQLFLSFVNLRAFLQLIPYSLSVFCLLFCFGRIIKLEKIIRNSCR